jgi:hypothetical protein
MQPMMGCSHGLAVHSLGVANGMFSNDFLSNKVGMPLGVGQHLDSDVFVELPNADADY